jgi:hypothetical protein
MASSLSSPSRRVQPTQCAVEVFQEGWWSAWVKRVLVLRSGTLLVYDEGVANCLATIRLGQIVKTAVPKSTDGHEFQFIVNNANAAGNGSVVPLRLRCGVVAAAPKTSSLAFIPHCVRTSNICRHESTPNWSRKKRSPPPLLRPPRRRSTPSNVNKINDDDDASPTAASSAASSSSSSGGAVSSRRRRTLSRRLSLTDLGQAFIPSGSESIVAESSNHASASAAAAVAAPMSRWRALPPAPRRSSRSWPRSSSGD